MVVGAIARDPYLEGFFAAAMAISAAAVSSFGYGAEFVLVHRILKILPIVSVLPFTDATVLALRGKV